MSIRTVAPIGTTLLLALVGVDTHRSQRLDRRGMRQIVPWHRSPGRSESIRQHEVRSRRPCEPGCLWQLQKQRWAQQLATAAGGRWRMYKRQRESATGPHAPCHAWTIWTKPFRSALLLRAIVTREWMAVLRPVAAGNRPNDSASAHQHLGEQGGISFGPESVLRIEAPRRHRALQGQLSNPLSSRLSLEPRKQCATYPG